MIDIENFKQFLTNNSIKSSRTWQQNIEAIIKFCLNSNSLSVYKLLNISDSSFSSRMKKQFTEFYGEKPRGAHWPGFLLLKYGYKRCQECHNIKSLEYFNKDISRYSGLNNKCRNCHNVHNKELYQTYYKENKSKFFARAAKRRALAYNAIDKYYTKKDDENIVWLRIFLENELEIKLHRDHIKSLSNGGKHNRFNWQILSVKANLKKGDRDNTVVYPIVSNKQLIMFLERI